MAVVAQLRSLGFDLPRLGFSLRTAVAACLAVALAHALGLEHPQWAGMTVWAASQPTRGQQLEKSLFRVAGTISGVIAGVALMLVSGGDPLLLVPGLAVWIALCAGIGNVQRGFMSYSTMLAGYSAAMVALLDTGHPGHVVALGVDRLATVLTGVLTAFVIGWLMSAREARDPLAGRLRALGARVLRDMAARGEGRDLAEVPAILSAIAELDELIDPSSAGRWRGRGMRRRMRRVLMGQVSALLWLRSPEAEPLSPPVRVLLLCAADEIGGDAPVTDVARTLDQVAEAAGPGVLAFVVSRMAAALRAYHDEDDVPDPPPVVLHRDWVGGRQAMIRSVVAILAAGGFWIVTGWSGGPFLMLGLSIMISLFSTFDNPAVFMRNVFWGQVLGCAGALACRWFVWPLAGSETQMIVMLMPFMVLGAFVLGHRRGALVGFDYNMVLLLLLQPVYPMTGSFGHSLQSVLAVTSAPVVAWVAYRLIYPVDGRARMAMLLQAMVGELRDMSLHPDRAGRTVWRARLYHRLLRLVRWTEKTGADDLSALDVGLAMFTIGSAIWRMQDIVGDMSVPASVRRGVRAALGRMAVISDDPARVAQAFGRAGDLLARAGDPAHVVVQAAARDIAAQQAVLRAQV